MIKWSPLLLIITLTVLPMTVIAGDIGGGGNMALRKAAKLNPNLKSQLLNSNSETEALNTWKQSMPTNKRQVLMKALFEAHVLPQLEE